MGVVGWMASSLIIAPLLIMAGFLLSGRGAWIIVRYNLKSKEERAKYNEKTLCRFVGGLAFFAALVLVLIGMSVAFAFIWLMNTLIVFLMVGLLGGPLYANLGTRRKR